MMSTKAEEWDADSETIRVLLVEDNPGDARLLREMLAEVSGGRLRLEWVDRLSGGLERLAAGGIDVVLLDLSLPDSQGLDTLAKMQAQAPHVPIIVLTGLEDEAVAVKAVKEGAQDYLVKGQVSANLLLRAARYAIERKRAAEALKRKTAELQTILINMGQGIAYLDENDTIIYVNQQCADLFGLKHEHVFGKNIYEFHAAQKREKIEALLNEFKNGKQSLNQIEAVKGKFLDVTFHRIEDDDGKYQGILMSAFDITERKKAEEEKQRLQEQLAHAQKMEAVGTLAGGIAHEFNNINAAIIGYIDFTLQMENLSSTARRNLEIVRSSVLRGADLTKNLLEFSRKRVAERKSLHLRDVVDEVLKVTEKEFTSEGIDVTVRQSMRVPPVLGDASLLSQVVMNLVINARHAMLKSPVKKLSVQTGLEGGRPFIRVKDTGCGIPKEDISRVFEPFFTTKGALASGGIYDGKAHGTGLGLSVCHSIVEAHDGEIKVESAVGKGTTFTVYLPAASERERVRGQAAEARKEGSARIMVVDDEKELTNLLVDVLANAGYAADGFTNPTEAMKALRQEQYSLAFIDLQMPEMAGEDFMERINRLPPDKRPLKVIVTGRLESWKEDVTRLNVFASLHKPFSNQQLLDIVKEGLAAHANRTDKVGVLHR